MDYAELDRLGDEIVELSAYLEAATARLLDRIREFDARAGWNTGFASCAHWLSWRVGLDLGAARERVRVARALGSLPRLAAALARGEISYAKVRAVTRVATPETEERLLAVARAGTAAHVERIVRGWRYVDRQAELREAARQHAFRGLHVYPDADGTVIVRGRLTPEAGALLLRALEAGRDVLYQRARAAAPAEPDTDTAGPIRVSAETPTMPQLQADALTLLAETALHHGIDPGAPGERYQVVVHVDAEVLADADHAGQSVLEDGVRVSAETSQRLACDASRVVMREDADGNLVEVGARTRTIPAQGGPTTLSNLAMLCRRHHRAVHEEGYQVERSADGTLTFRRPNGWDIPAVPDPPVLARDPLEVIWDTNLAHGVSIDADTLTPGWLGERLDVVYAIDVLHPLALAARPGDAPERPRHIRLGIVDE